jgi:DNA-binding transcriptional MerR regulator
LQTIHNMETRVLTLFDDEEFFPKEEPKKKPKKEPKIDEVEHTEDSAKKIENPEPAVTENHTSDHTTFPVDLQPESVDEPPVNQEHEIIDELKNEIPEAALAEKPVVAEEEHFSVAEEVAEEHVIDEDGNQDIYEELDSLNQDNDPQPEEEEEEETTVAADKDELNKQILSELIQMDYTALIHRDYPFDVNKASVVEKKEPAKTEPADDTEPTEACETEDDEVFEDIVPLPEWNLDKKYYTIGEVAQLFAVNTSHIRFWTNEFKLKPRTTRKGDRLYNPKDIAELRLIHHLVKEKKHTIKGAKEKLKAGKNDVNNKLDLKDSLINLRDTLLQIKAQL